jgi:hypothetical protein
MIKLRSNVASVARFSLGPKYGKADSPLSGKRK